MNPGDLRAVAPELVVAGGLLLLLVWDLLVPPPWRRAASLAAIAVGAVATLVLLRVGPSGAAFGGTYQRDALTQALQVTALLTTVLGVALSPDYLRRLGFERSEYYALLLASCLGAMVMAASTDLIVLFLGLETLSIPLYILAAFRRGNVRSQEAGLKYFLLGSFSTAFFLYGVALLYGAAASTRLVDLSRAAQFGLTPLLGGGVALLTIGLAFKAALVPFHAWAPDVYEGSPLPVTAYMSVIAKVGAFAALARIFPLALAGLQAEWQGLLVALAVLTLVLGNLVAILQRSMKRLLAYSSIAHAGYLLIGVAAGSAAGLRAMVYYLAVYLFMTLGAFAVVLLLERAGDEVDAIDDYAGLGGRAPWLAGAMTVFMVSLAGLPPTAGFVGKFFLFAAALDGGQVGLVLVGVLTTVVSVYYYLRVPYVMFLGAGPDAAVGLTRSRATRVVALATAGAVLLIGVLPWTLFQAVEPLADLLTR